MIWMLHYGNNHNIDYETAFQQVFCAVEVQDRSLSYIYCYILSTVFFYTQCVYTDLFLFTTALSTYTDTHQMPFCEQEVFSA